MSIGYLFPGQGTQTIGMGKDLYEKYEEVREIYNKVKEVTGIDIAKISFEGPEEELNKTQNTQLAVLTESLAILEVLKKKGIKAEMSAGLSLGEYTALIEDGVFSLEEGIKLVQKRGEIMQNYTPKGTWKMAAILGLDEKSVEEVCKKVEDGFVVPANYNTIGQIVISGEEDAVIKAVEFAKEAGTKKVAILNTAGPFHTSKLSDCSAKLKEVLENTPINSKDSKVIKNIDGTKYSENDNVAEILANHIMNPVRFTSCLQTMFDNGVDTFVEVGPGRTLSAFVKRMKFEGEISIITLNNVQALEDYLNII